MKVNEIINKLKDEDICCAGIRFDDRLLKVGDKLDNSRHNADREDAREFPEYGTSEYEEMEELDGTCAYNCYHIANLCDDMNDLKGKVLFDHCYVIAGNDWGSNDELDEGEVVIKNAKVLATIF